MKKSNTASRLRPFTLAAAAVDRAEVHQHLSGGTVSVADAQDNQVTFISLDILQILDEQAHELPVNFAFQLGFVDGVAQLPRRAVRERHHLVGKMNRVVGFARVAERSKRLAEQGLQVHLA